MSSIGPEYLRRLLDEYWSPLVLYARQWSDEPEDVVQEAIIKLVGQSELPGDPVAWLYRVVRHQAISSLRGRKRRQLREKAIAHQELYFDSDSSSIDAAAATESLNNLPEDVREVIVMRIWGELTLQQISDIRGISTATAHRRYQEGIEKLREILGNE